MRRETSPPPTLPPPGPDGYYHFPSGTIPLGMIQGWYYLPFRLTPLQMGFDYVLLVLSMVNMGLGFLFWKCSKKVAWTPAKWLILNMVFIDWLQTIFNAFWLQGPTIFIGHHLAGRIMCQVMGFVSTVWGAASQQAVLLFTLERYITIVHGFAFTFKHVRMAIVNVWISAIVLGIFPFAAQRHAAVAPSGLYCNPPWSNGGDWVGIFIGVCGVGFIGMNMVGVVWMYTRIYAKFQASTKEVAAAMRDTLSDTKSYKSAEATDDDASLPPPTLTSTAPSASGIMHPTRSVMGAQLDRSTETRDLSYRLAMQSLIIIITYFLSMSPMWISIDIHLFTQMPPPAWWDNVAITSAHLYAVMNPVLFLTLNKHWTLARTEVLKEWRGWIRKVAGCSWGGE
ncbi:hypothetical protein SpCBS45565_g05182 [Spizellomyces sp. 'palustris']|nr:hypothetical protein SpCBS45565_g05182 [Spizellomyces sp. 'palustris']